MVAVDPGDEVSEDESYGGNEEMDIDIATTNAHTETPDTGIDMDGVEPTNSPHHDPLEDLQRDRLVIAVDFGTTFSSVAYVSIPSGLHAKEIDIKDVKCIGNYPGYNPVGNEPDRQDVPTELWYDLQTIDEPEVADESARRGWGLEEYECVPQMTEERPESAVMAGSTAKVQVEKYWGFQVQERLQQLVTSRQEAGVLTRFKLSLNSNPHTQTIRNEVRKTQEKLLLQKFITHGDDIYRDFLVQLMAHTKHELQRKGLLQPGVLIQYVLCVPAKWPVSACRKTESALEQALQMAGLDEQGSPSAHNLFMISEPEAAAECIFAEQGFENSINVSNSSAFFLC